MLIIGLMLVRNESDILKEVLSEHFKFSDHIFVLDGTSEKSEVSEEICRAFKNLDYFQDDQLPLGYPRPIRDGCRQFLLEKAREKFGAQGWIVLLHGDEIFVDSPRDIIQKYDRWFDCLTLDNLLFFIHKEQDPFRFDPCKSLQDQIYWYAGPGWPEMRLFKNKACYNYDIFQHRNVTPKGILINYKTTFKVKHYSLRDPSQQKKRAEDRLKVTRFSLDGYGYQYVTEGRYYLDESCFNGKSYHWISKKPLRPRIRDGFFKRLGEDLSENFSSGKIRI